MTTTRVFRSTDSSAPALSGVVGSGIAWLKACLVGNGSGVAYGSGVNQKASAGWSLAFEDTVNHVAVFRNSLAAGGSGVYLRVEDGGAGAGGAKDMVCRLYGTMSDVNTGTDETPTVAAQATGVVWAKSATANSTSRAWVLIADECTVYLGVWPGYGGSPKEGHQIGAAGDYATDDPSQPYPCLIAGANLASTNATWGPARAGIAEWLGFSTNAGIWCMRGPAGAAGAINATLPMLLAPTGSSGGMGGSLARLAATPPGSGGQYFQPGYLFGGSTVLGQARGLYAPLCNMTAYDLGDEIASAQGLPSASRIVLLRAATAQVSSTQVYAYVGIEAALEW